MLREGGFHATLDKLSDVVQRLNKETEETVNKKQLKIKYQVAGTSQYFLESFEEKTGIRNIFGLFTEDVAWNKIGFDFSNYDHMGFTVTIADTEFDAKLTKIDVSIREKKGLTTFTYVLTLEKEEEARVDSIVSNLYLKKMIKDDNGKVVPEQFVVTMKSLVNSDVADTDLLK